MQGRSIFSGQDREINVIALSSISANEGSSSVPYRSASFTNAWNYRTLIGSAVKDVVVHILYPYPYTSDRADFQPR